MPATTIQLCLYDGMHRRKIPHHCSPFLSSGSDREILMSGAESEEFCNVRVHELVKYQVQLEEAFLMFREL